MVFVLDSTLKIKRLRELTLHIIITSLLQIGLDQSLVGLIKFSCASQLIFNLNTYTSDIALYEALEAVPYSYKCGPSDLGGALSLLQKTTQDGTMGLREGRTHVTIFITDGSSSDIEETIHQTNFLHDANIYQVYAAGFGDAN